MLAARASRVAPARDGKVVAGLERPGYPALAEAGLLLSRADFISAATQAAELLAEVHLAGGRLLRTSRDGFAGESGGALETTPAWRKASGLVRGDRSGPLGEPGRDLLDVALRDFPDGQGGFYDTAIRDERLICRPADPADNATPSATFAMRMPC